MIYKDFRRICEIFEKNQNIPKNVGALRAPICARSAEPPKQFMAKQFMIKAMISVF